MIALDLVATSIDAISLISLLVVGIVGVKTVRRFEQSKQAVTESASLITVIVEALAARIQRTEAVLTALRSDMAMASRRCDAVETQQAALRASNQQMLGQLQDILSNDRRLIAELEQLKSNLGSMPQQRTQPIEGLPKRENFSAVMSEGDVLASLTRTERRTLEILRVEGAKGAPELGKRLEKSREHTSRLMKKLYMEGYVSRETNHAPFRYKLNDVVGSALESADRMVTAEQRAAR